MKIDEKERDFRNKVKIWSKKMQVFPYEVHLKRMKKRWGYCTSEGIVNFNSELLFMDESKQDFVIVHELLHLKVPNHGNLFRSLMSAYLPDWREEEKKLLEICT